MMNYTTKKTLFAVLAVCLFATVAQAQKPERIDFSKEQSDALVWEVLVPPKGTKSYVFKAQKGQKLMLGFIDDTDQGSMDLGKVSIEPNTDPFQTTIEVTKDYNFSVTNNSNEATSFRIFITLENPKVSAKKNQKSETVRFAKGETSASLTRTIPALGSIDFIINAKKGQKMGFTIGYDFSDSDVQGFLTEPGSQDISLSTGPKSHNDFVLQTSGNHRLTVNNTTAKEITITLYLDIE